MFLCLLFLNGILCLDKGAALVERELTIAGRVDVNVMEFMRRRRINVK